VVEGDAEGLSPRTRGKPAYGGSVHILNAKAGTKGRTDKLHFEKQDSLIKCYEDDQIILTITCQVVDPCGGYDSCIASKLSGTIKVFSKTTKKNKKYSVECLCGC
jgi:hypothetical protein